MKKNQISLMEVNNNKELVKKKNFYEKSCENTDLIYVENSKKSLGSIYPEHVDVEISVNKKLNSL